MIGSKTFPVISLLSAGCGFWIGRKYEQWKDKELFNDENNNNKNVKSLFHLPLATIISALDDPPKGKQDTERRYQEITKYGKPSFGEGHLYNDFILSYDTERRNPRWVLEHLTPDNLKFIENINRNEYRFEVDTSINKRFRTTVKDYTSSKYDKGHLAAANNHRVSKGALKATFLLSNVSPQVKGFNQGIWNDLEKYVRAVAMKNKNVYVCTGPLYLPKSPKNTYVEYEVIGENKVAVPTHFFKALIIEDKNGNRKFESYKLPNEIIENKNPENYMCHIKEIEKDAGFKLFNLINEQ